MPSPLAVRLTLLLRARLPYIAITTDGEDHVLAALVQATLALHPPVVRWSSVEGKIEGSFTGETTGAEGCTGTEVELAVIAISVRSRKYRINRPNNGTFISSGPR